MPKRSHDKLTDLLKADTCIVPWNTNSVGI